MEISIDGLYDTPFTVNILDEITPIVILFGPPASGKFMFIIRMTRYLEEMGCRVVPEVSFRPCSDISYKRGCENFRECAYSVYMHIRTPDFLLLKVIDPKGTALCQIIYAPGEFYYNPHCHDSNLIFPTALQQTPNRKIWMFFVEQGWEESQGERNQYAKKICSMQNRVSPNDKVIFLFNKADKHCNSQYNGGGRPILSTFLSNISQQYPGIFNKYQNRGLHRCSSANTISKLFASHQVVLFQKKMKYTVGFRAKIGIVSNYGKE